MTDTSIVGLDIPGPGMTEEIVAPVRAAYDEMWEFQARAVKEILPYAIKLGAELIEAKEKVSKELEVNWEHWVKENLASMLSYRSVNDYMLLAQHQDISQHAASIRDALKQIAAKREAEGKKRKSPNKPPTPSAPSVAASAEPKGEAQSSEAPPLAPEPTMSVPDLKGVLECDPDKVLVALVEAKWDVAALRKLADNIQRLTNQMEQLAAREAA
jgi:hypothetical protein